MRWGSGEGTEMMLHSKGGRVLRVDNCIYYISEG